MEIFQRDGALQLRLKRWEEIKPGLYAGFTTRNGGNSTGAYGTLNMGLHVHDRHDTVIDNRTYLSQLIPFPVNTWVCGEQTHQTNIHIVRTADMGKGALTHESSLAQI